MDGRIFDGVFTLIVVLAIVTVISVPLAVWKLVEIIIWIVEHVHFA